MIIRLHIKDLLLNRINVIIYIHHRVYIIIDLKIKLLISVNIIDLK